MKTFKQYLIENLQGQMKLGKWNGESEYQSPKFNTLDQDFQFDYEFYQDTKTKMFYAALDDDVPGEWAAEGKTLKDCVKDLLGNVEYQYSESCDQFAWAFDPDANQPKRVKNNLNKLACGVTIIATSDK